MSNTINYGMVGGGTDAFIGEIHRIAAKIDNKYVIRFVTGTYDSKENDVEKAYEIIKKNIII